MPTATTLPLEDWLAISRDPNDADHAGLYFVGTFDTRITFYSQQVRALRLAQALVRGNRLGANDLVAVVGGGAAGMTAALALAVLGRDVTLYDPANGVLQLQSASPRLLHPHIYEWPKLGSLDDNAGLPLLNWSAGTGSNVIAALKASFNAADTRLGTLRFKNGHQLNAIEREGNAWKLKLVHEGAEIERQFPHVIFAMGFGEELSCGASVPTDYWRPTGVGTAADEPHVGTRYLVSGNGDGGLTELLGLLVTNFEHLAFTQRFLHMFAGDSLRAATEKIYTTAARGDDLQSAFETHLAPLLAQQAVLDRIEPLIRTDRAVTINASGPLFEAGKAAQLNQCMVFAVLAAAAGASVAVSRTGNRITDVVQAGQDLRVQGTDASGSAVEDVFRYVILRHGPNRSVRFAPVVAPYNAYKAYMATLLAARPDLAEPPALDAETYQLFADEGVAKLFDVADQPARTAQLQLQRHTIVISIDAATHIPIERGAMKLARIAGECERLSAPVTIRVDAPPAAIPAAKNLVRLARASGGKIHLKAAPDVQGAWATLDSMIVQTPAEPSNFAAMALGADDLAEAIDACLLRLLDAKITDAISDNNCPTLGNIDPALIAEIATTWANWRTEMEAARQLRADFLRWLANVDQREVHYWDGVHEHLPHLVSALVLMLATHHGEALKPASSDQGNLLFATDAVALGSGCGMIDGEPIAARTDPRKWGVEALILSASAEIDIVDMEGGTVKNAGSILNGVEQGRKIRPAVIQNNHYWRGKLAGTLDHWKLAIEEEFARFRARQNEEYEKVSK